MAEDDEELWVSSQREAVAAYLKAQGLSHGEIGEWPAWHVAPHVSIWAVESLANPGWVGWWAITGDLPGDYCSAEVGRHPRLALKHFAQSWRAAADNPRPDGTLGETGLPSSFAEPLRHRASILAGWADDDAIWAELG